MTVNEYVKRWCDESYDIKKEDFFVANAYYVAEREWAIAGFKHLFLAVFAGLIAFVAYGANQSSLFVPVVNSVLTMGIMTACFWFYAVRKFDDNDPATSIVAYIAIALFLLIAQTKMPNVIKAILTAPSVAGLLYYSIIKPIKFIKIARDMKKRIIEEETEEETTAKDKYAKWKRDYESFRYGLPEAKMDDSDPMMEEAYSLFDGFRDSAATLKTRFRQLAKQYHPDHGGDTKLFQCIIAVYDEYKAQFA